jgi:hypothetical protein
MDEWKDRTLWESPRRGKIRASWKMEKWKDRGVSRDSKGIGNRGV